MNTVFNTPKISSILQNLLLNTEGVTITPSFWGYHHSVKKVAGVIVTPPVILNS